MISCELFSNFPFFLGVPRQIWGRWCFLRTKLGDEENAGYQQEASGPPAVHMCMLSVPSGPSRRRSTQSPLLQRAIHLPASLENVRAGISGTGWGLERTLRIELQHATAIWRHKESFSPAQSCPHPRSE